MSVSSLPRTKTFADEIQTIISSTEPDQLAEAIAAAHADALQPHLNEIQRMTLERSCEHEDARRGHYMLDQAQNSFGHEVMANRRLSAAAHHLKDQVSVVRRLAAQSFNGQLNACDIEAALAFDVRVPQPSPVPVGFHPAADYAAGRFATADHSVTQVLTFVGYTTMARPGEGTSTELTFLVPERGALPAGMIEAERGMRLEYPLLPMLRPV